MTALTDRRALAGDAEKGFLSHWFQPKTLAGVAPILVILGPYVAGPVRIEHLVIYGFLAIGALSRNRFVRLVPGPVVIVSLLVIPLLVSALGTAVLSTEVSFARPTGALAAADNWLLPAATVLLGASWLTIENWDVLLRRVCLSTVIALATNTFITIFQATSSGEADAFLAPFWTSDRNLEGFTVAQSAASGGRFSGVFNQPAEAGIAYSIGLFMCLYLALVLPKKWPYWSTLSGLMVLGGTLATSKILLLFALPVFLVSVMLMLKRLKLFALGLSFPLVAFTLLGERVSWSLDRLGVYFSSYSLFDASGVTAGRWGTGTSSTGTLFQVLEINPLLGLGLNYFGGSSDSEWVRLIGQSGLIGIGCFIAIIFVFVARLMRNATGLSQAARWLAGVLLALVVASSFGLPTLSANKAGAILSMVLSITLCGTAIALTGKRSKPRRSI